MALPVAPTVKQDRWAPTWLLDLSYVASTVFGTAAFQGEEDGGFQSNAFQTTGFVPLQYTHNFLFATRPIDRLAVPWRGRIVNDPIVSTALRDTFWGTVEVSEITVTIANGDGFLNPMVDNDVRGQPFLLHRYDAASDTIVATYHCTVLQVYQDAGIIEVVGASPNLGILEQKIPKDTVTTELFGDRVVDQGATIPVVLHRVRKLKLPYIHDGVPNNRYDYLVGYGNLTVTAVYRDGPRALLSPEEQALNEPGPFVLVTTPEYVVSTILYPGYTVIRFRYRQRDFSSGFHTIYADVTGDALHANFAHACAAVLGNPTWGLGQPVDSAAITAAAAALPAALICEGAITEQTEAQNILDQLMIVRGMQLGLSGTGSWTLTVDTPRETIALQATAGVGDGNRVIRRAGRRGRKSLRDSIGIYTLHYRLDQPSGRFKVTKARTVTEAVVGQLPGQDRDLENQFLWDHTAADMVIDYLAKRERIAAETVEVTFLQEGRALQVGDLVQLTVPPLGYVDAVLEIRSLDKGQVDTAAVLSPYSEALYVYTPEDDPLGTIDINDVDDRIPAPGGLQLVGPSTAGLVTIPDPEFGGQVAGLGNRTEWTGRNVRITWHEAVPLPPFRGYDEDSLGQFTALRRGYLVTIIGTFETTADEPDA